jgi:hypothetical protein
MTCVLALEVVSLPHFEDVFERLQQLTSDVTYARINRAGDVEARFEDGSVTVQMAQARMRQLLGQVSGDWKQALRIGGGKDLSPGENTRL